MRTRSLLCSRSGLLGALVALAGCLLFVAAGSARAAEGHFPLSSFATFGAPQSIAVDEATGDVYVLDYEKQSIQRFDAAGNPAEFAALGSNVLDGSAGADATPEGGFSFFSGGGGQVAIDNSSGPNKGDIYVANMFDEVVDIFSPEGTYLGELTSGSGTAWGLTCGVAVDGSGNVYVGVFQRAIDEFASTGGTVSNGDFKSSVQGELGRICTIAADHEGDVYALNVFDGPLVKWTAAQFGSGSAGTPFLTSAEAVAVDQANGRVLADFGTQVGEYDPQGNSLGAFGEGIFSESLGLGVNGASGKVYVADDERSEVHIFTGNVLMPDISVEAPSHLSETGVTLNASIDPDGLDASCKVQYGTDASYGGEASCSPADLGAGSQPVTATAVLSGLTPKTIYHYRFVTVNPNGVEYGFDHSFASGSKPAVDGESQVDASSTTATINALVNPNNIPTTFQVEYGLNSAYGSSSPVPASNVGSGGSDQSVTWTLVGLQPATSYHYRVVATDAFGTVYGADQAFTTLSLASAGGGSCSNAAIREIQRATYLPDCRAYEQVSPVEKGSANISTEPTRDQAATSGDAVKYWSPAAFGALQGTEIPGAEYISLRGLEGWSTHAINPQQQSPTSQGLTSEYVYMSADLSKGIFYARSPIGAGHPNIDEVPNFYLRSDVFTEGAGDYQLMSDSISPLSYELPTVSQRGVAFAAASSDLAHVAFESSNDLTTETTGLSTVLPKAYEWDDGTLRLAGILPGGEPASSSVVGGGAGGGVHTFVNQWINRGAVSSDGSRVIFTGPPLARGRSDERVSGNLYMRIDGTHTIQLNVSERSEPDPEGFRPAEFWAASADGSKVFFLSRQMLTDDAKSEGADNLYMYDVNAPEGEHLTLISRPENPNSACLGCSVDPAVAVAGISEDGSYVYFDGGPLVAGQKAGEGLELYVWHEGKLRPIAERAARENLYVTGAWGDVYPEWYPGAANMVRVTPDGRSVVFVSAAPSTAEAAGVSNLPAHSGACADDTAGIGSEICAEVYLYNYESNRLTCVSCRPAGTRPDGEASFSTSADTGPLDHITTYLSHPISSDGRYVFFESNDSLVPQASDGKWNVYEYDTQTDQVHLISGGTCDCDSHFIDASASGDDVFFTTAQQLVHSDVDVNVDMYDARVNGGLASQNQVEAPPCTGSACQGSAESAPSFSLPASATFSGVGNVAAAAPKAAPKKPKAKPKRKRKKKKARGRAGRAKRTGQGAAARSGKRRTRATRPVRPASRRAGR